MAGRSFLSKPLFHVGKLKVTPVIVGIGALAYYLYSKHSPAAQVAQAAAAQTSVPPSTSGYSNYTIDGR